MLINPFEDLMTLEDAAREWEVEAMDIIEKIANEDLIKDIDVRKFKDQWIVTRHGMTRIFGSIIDSPVDLIMANMPYASSRYESYVANAFEAGREGDPARLALDLIFDMSQDSPEHFAKSKAAASYASYIYNQDLLTNYREALEDNEDIILDTMSQSIVQAQDKAELFDALDRHYSQIELIYNRD